MTPTASLRRIYIYFAFAFVAALTVGCGGNGKTVTTLAITASSATTAAGDTNQLHAKQASSSGDESDVTTSAIWSSSDISVATVSTTGLLTAVTPGNATISARLKTASGSLAFSVGNAAITKLTVTPVSAVLFTKGKQQFTASAAYSNSTSGDASSKVAWSVTPTSVATISATGLLTGVGAGKFTVTARAGSITSSVTGTVNDPTLVSITINPTSARVTAGTTQQFLVIGTYNDRSTKTITTGVSWTSSNTSVLTINASGLATAASVLKATALSVAAQVGSMSATSAVSVNPHATMTSMQVRPTSSSIAEGTAEKHTAIGFFSDGTQQDVTDQANWTVTPSDLSVRYGHGTAARAGGKSVRPSDDSTSSITVNQSGVDYANAPGAANVQANLGTLQSQSVVLVTDASIRSIAIASPELLFPIGTKQPFSLTGWFSDGSSQDLTLTANWQSSNPSVASIDETGVVTGVSAGTVTISARFGALTTSLASVRILPSDLISTTIELPFAGMVPGTVENASVIGTYSDGTSQDLTRLATWQSSNTTVVQVDNTGFVQSVGAGLAQITATVGGVSSEAAITTVDTKLVSMKILPVDVSFALGTSVPFTAIGFFADGAQIDLSASVLWTSSDPTVFTIDATGRAKSGSVGSAVVTASDLGVSASSTAVQVTAATLSRMTLSSVSTQIAEQTHEQYAATGYFSDGSVQDLTNDVLWSVGDGTLASVDLDGTVLGLRPGTVQVFATANNISSSTTLTATTSLTITNATLVSTVISPGAIELPAGLQRPLSLIGTFSDGTNQNLSDDAIWQSPTPSVTFASMTGVVVGVSPGVGTISAEVGNFSSSTQVRVTNASLTGIVLTPSTSVIRVSGTQLLTATATFSDGYSQNLYPDAIFVAADDKIARIGLDGIAIGRAIGTTQITASFRGLVSSVSSIQVESGTLSSIAVTPANPVVSSGSTLQLTATGTYADGTTSDLSSQVTWTSSNAAAVGIDSTGIATAHTVTIATPVTITVSDGSVSKTFQLVVYPASGGAVTSLVVTPSSASVAIGGTQQFTATATYADNVTQNVTVSASWSSSSPAIANTSVSGLATGLATGSAQMTAQFGGVSASSALTVTAGLAPILRSFVITPTSSTVVTGLSQQFNAIGTYSDGSTQNLNNSVTWISSSASIASVNSSGLVTGIAAGTVTVTGTMGVFQSQTTIIISPATITSVALSPSGVSLPVGTTQQLNLTGTFSDGTHQNLNSAASWSTLAPGIAGVSLTGLVSAIAPGTAQISASYGGQTASTTAQITPATLVSIAVSPSSLSLGKGTSQQFTVTGTYSDGTTHDLTGAATFTSSKPSITSVTSTGLATALAIGTAQISVSANGETTTAQVTITPATLVSIVVSPYNPTFAKGTTQQFTAIGTYSDGTTQDLSTQAVWTSSNPASATIDADGLASAGTPGTIQISATVGSVTASTGDAQVTAAVLTALSITPTTAQIAKGTSQQFTATGTYSDGTTQNLSSAVSWTSSNGAVTSVNSTGLAFGAGIGQAQLSASFDGFSASTSSFAVSAATLVSIAFNPASPSVAVGTSAQVTVTGTFSDGTTQSLTSTAGYSSSNNTAVTVSNTGLISGVAAGNSTVTVTVDGVTSSFVTVVTNATLQSITIAPATPPSFAKGTTQQFTATGNYSDGSTQDLTTAVAWVSSNPAVFTIDSNGLATGTGTGSATLTATDQGQSVTTPAIQVTPAIAASLVVAPSTASVTVGSSQQFTVTATYTDATTADVTASAIWTSSNPSSASVSASGLALGSSVGSTNISASYEGVSASSALTVAAVAAPTLQSIAVTPSAANVAKGNTQQFVAVGTYSDGSTQTLTSVATWQSSSVSVATVDGNGVATGVSGGNTQIWSTYQGVSGVATLAVSPATVVSLSVTPATVSIANGTSQQYQAIGTLSDGSTQDLSASVTWSSSNNSTAMINASGFATSNGVGSTTITAQAGSVSRTAAMTVTAATVVSVQVTPSSVTLPAGGVQQLLVTANFTDGSSQNVTTSAAYTSSNAAVATVDANGKLIAVGRGSAAVTISLGSATANLPVTITSAALTSIAITPSTLSLPVGQSQQMTATGTFSDGSTQDLTNSVAWSSSTPHIALVSTSGDITVNQTGSATIVATDGSITGSVAVTGTNAVVTALAVSPASITLAAGQTQQFAATATLSDGSQQTVTTSAHWSTSDPSKGTISNTTGTDGLLQTNAAGTFNVVASLNSVSGTASTTVTSAVLTSLTVSPNPATLPAGTTQALFVTGNYTDGSTANLTSSTTWSSSRASVATVDANGTLQGVTTGTATVTATVGSTSGTDAVTVTSATLNSIAITSSSSSVPLGLQLQLTATGSYSDGSTQNLTSQVQWSSSSPSIATVSGTGLASALAIGSTQLTATLNGVSQQSQLTVTAAALESIAVQASQSSFALGLSLQLTAIGTYSDSSTQTLTNLVTWSSQSPTVGLVSSTGLATGLTTGAFNARATLSGVSGSLAITVNSAVLQSIVVTPANTVIVHALGNGVQFIATGHFSDGSTQDITDSCHWAITGGLALGSVSATGNFSATGLGLGTMNATSGSITGSTGFTVLSLL